MAIISRASVTPPKHPLTDAGSDGEDPLLRNLEYSDGLLASGNDQYHFLRLRCFQPIRPRTGVGSVACRAAS